MTAIYTQYGGALSGAIFKVVHDKELARDIFQEALVKIWQNAASYQPKKARLYTWMLTLCRNAAIDALRSKDFKMDSKIHGDENSVDSNESDLGTNPDEIGVGEMTEILPPPEKDIIDLAYFHGFTQKEISEELNLPLGTIKTKTRTALSKLKAHFN